MSDLYGFDPAADGERGYALYCEWRRLRHEAATSRRIGAAAERVAALAREIRDTFNPGDANDQTENQSH